MHRCYFSISVMKRCKFKRKSLDASLLLEVNTLLTKIKEHRGPQTKVQVFTALLFPELNRPCMN